MRDHSRLASAILASTYVVVFLAVSALVASSFADRPRSRRGARSRWSEKVVAAAAAFVNAYSYELDGTTERLYRADEDDLECNTENKLSVCSWLNQDAYAAGEAPFAKWRHATQNTFACATYHANRSMLCYIADACNDAGSNYEFSAFGSVPTSGWFHFCMVYDGSLAAANRLTLYADGVASSGGSGGTIPATLQDCTSEFTVGSWDVAGSLDRYWGAGHIDEVYAGCEALSAADVLDMYNSGAPKDSSGLFSDLRVWLRADNDTMPTATNQGSAGDFTGQNMDATNLVADVP